eukprot:3667-Prymnesium_polylepis.2
MEVEQILHPRLRELRSVDHDHVTPLVPLGVLAGVLEVRRHRAVAQVEGDEARGLDGFQEQEGRVPRHEAQLADRAQLAPSRVLAEPVVVEARLRAAVLLAEDAPLAVLLEVHVAALLPPLMEASARVTQPAREVLEPLVPLSAAVGEIEARGTLHRLDE